MGRKSKIARGLNIGAAARKMLEKATGTVLTDEEYFTLEHQALESPIERNLEDIERVLTQEFPMQEEWWEPYVKPLPTWDIYDPRGYGIALTSLRRMPPSIRFTEPTKKGLVTGIIISEGWVGFVIADKIYACIRVNMMERQPVDFLSETMGVKTYEYVYKEVYMIYYFHVQGLRGYLLANYAKDVLMGRRRDIAKFIVKHGYTIKPETLEQFRTKFHVTRKYARVIKEGSGEIVWGEAYLVPPEERPPLEPF